MCVYWDKTTKECFAKRENFLKFYSFNQVRDRPVICRVLDLNKN